MSQSRGMRSVSTLNAVVSGVVQEGPVSLTEQPRVLASFLTDLQRICIHRGYAVESDPIANRRIRMINAMIAIELEVFILSTMVRLKLVHDQASRWTVMPSICAMKTNGAMHWLNGCATTRIAAG